MLKPYIKNLLRAPWIVNYNFDGGVEALFQYVLKNKDLIKNAKRGMFETSFDICDMSVTLWTENRYYAYASRGSIAIKGKTVHTWESRRPSRMVIAELSYLLDSMTPAPETNEQKVNRLLSGAKRC